MTLVAVDRCPCCSSIHFACIAQISGAHLMWCRGCGSYFFAEQPTQAELTAYYAGGEYSERQRSSLFEQLSELRAQGHFDQRVSGLRTYLARFRGTKRILDFGCSYGFLLEAAARQGFEPYGVELDPEVAVYNRNLGVHMIDAAALASIRDGFFSIITANHIVEHLPDSQATLSLLARKLAPGGVMAISTPCFSAALVGNDATKLFDVVYPEHLVFFTVNGMRQLLTRVGLLVEQCFSQYANHEQVLRTLDSMDPGSVQPTMREILERPPLGAGANLSAVARKPRWALSTPKPPVLDPVQVAIAPFLSFGRVQVLTANNGGLVEITVRVPLEASARQVAVSAHLMALGSPGLAECSLVGPEGGILASMTMQTNRQGHVYAEASVNPGDEQLTLRIRVPSRTQVVLRDALVTLFSR